MVLVDAPGGDHRYDAVVSDNEGGAYAAVSHLIGLGHREIALVAPHPQADPVFTQRRDGYLRAIHEHGLSSYSIADARTPDEAGAAVAPLLQLQPQITALFGSNDAVTIVLAGREMFKTGGQITILNSLAGPTGAALDGTTVFTITVGGKAIKPS